MIDEKNSEYEIKDTIGKGNFGKVLLAINKKTKEKVAIKIIEKSKMNKYYSSVQIERELSVIGQMNHLNIIKIHKIVSDKKKYEIIMEYCEKGELYEYIVNKRKLEEDETAYYFFQLINGLESIHSKNIVHRDLKPENLLITKDNILKIIDFGLCNYHNPEKLLTTPCGSPSYASPEMVSGKEYNGIFVDIWCTGIILYAMLAGYLPFEGNDNFSLFKKIIKCEVEYPRDTPKMALDLMEKILVNDPNKRISINGIKKHPFYLKGKKIFGAMHKEYIKELERPIMRKIISNYNSFKGKGRDSNNSREQNNFFKKKKIEIKKKKNKNEKEISPKYFQNKDRNLWGRKSVGGSFNKNILCFNIPIINSNDKRIFADEHNNVYKETEIFHKKNFFNLKRNNINKQIFFTENNHDKDVIKYIKPLLSPRKSHIAKGRKIGEDNYIYNSSKNLNNFEKFNRKKYLDKDSPPPSYKNAPYKRPSLKDLNFDSFSQRNTVAANKSIKLNDQNINVSSNLSSIRNPFLHRIFNLKKNENNDRNNFIINSYINNHKSFNSSDLKDENYIYEKKHKILKNSHKDKLKSNNSKEFDIYFNMSSAQTSKKQILRNNILFFPNLNKISNGNKDKNLYKNTKNEEDNSFKPNYQDFDNKFINSDINSVKTKKKNNCRTISDITSKNKILNNRYYRNKVNQIDKLFNSQEKIFVKKQIESNSIKNNKMKKNTIQIDINSNIFQKDNRSIKKLPIERKKINAVIFNNQINQLNIYKNGNNSYDFNQIFFCDGSHFCKTEENEPNLNKKDQTKKEFNTLIISKDYDDENNQFQSLSTQKNIIRRKIYPKEDKFKYKENNSNYLLTNDGKKLNKNKISKINTNLILSKKNKEKRYINANNKEIFNKRKIDFVK